MKPLNPSSKKLVLILSLALSLHAISCGGKNAADPVPPTDGGGNGSSAPTVTHNPPPTVPDPRPGTDGKKEGQEFQKYGCKDCEKPVGEWGKPGAGAILTERGATFKFDCAYGTTDTLSVDANGHFDASGTLRFQDDQVPARYHGTIRGDEMHLNVSYVIRGKPIEASYPLALNAPAIVEKCE